jgi:ferredoxin--NADP+ reductase
MMFEIKNKQILAQSIKQIEVSAPELAAKAQAGQFVILRIDETGERIPLTLADFDREMGTITLIYQEVGRTTLDLGRLEAGDYLLDLVGPLGKPSEIEKYGTVVCSSATGLRHLVSGEELLIASDLYPGNILPPPFF